MQVKKMAKTVVMVALLVGLPIVVMACYGYRPLEELSTKDLVQEVAKYAQRDRSVEKPSPYIRRVIAVLRQESQAGLDALIAHRQVVREEANKGVSAEGDKIQPGSIQRFDRLIDSVAQQRFAAHSGLFWYTSLDDALSKAQKQRRPVLSLRMLGRLDQDLSCANSRFFRTTLYPDPAIAKRLRSDYILHWAPVRQVPIVTVDYGDGRKLRRPLTGNSLHMVLSSDGTPLDVLPGLVSPTEFDRWLNATSEWITSSELLTPGAISVYHADRAACRRSESEMAVGSAEQISALNPLDPRWETEAQRFTDFRLSDSSIALVAQNRPGPGPAMVLARSKAITETPMMRMVRTLTPMIARDTAFNLYALQTKVDDMYARRGTAFDPNELIEEIYASVFLMPLSDPWLGLSPDDEFVALEKGGRIDPNRSQLNLFLQASQ